MSLPRTYTHNDIHIHSSTACANSKANFRLPSLVLALKAVPRFALRSLSRTLSIKIGRHGLSWHMAYTSRVLRLHMSPTGQYEPPSYSLIYILEGPFRGIITRKRNSGGIVSDGPPSFQSRQISGCAASNLLVPRTRTGCRQQSLSGEHRDIEAFAMTISFAENCN